MNTKSYKINSRSLFWLSVLFFVFLSYSGNAQRVNIQAEQKKLSEVLVGLRDSYQLQFSFDDSLLSSYFVTVHQEFDSPEQALDFLLEGLPLAYEKKRGVFVIFPTADPQFEKVTYRYSGRFVDARTGEALPYTHVLADNFGTITDQMGNFQLASEDSVIQLKASHLGFYLMDTVLFSGGDHLIQLRSFNIKLKEVRVEGLRVVKNLQVGDTPGSIRLNHQVANYLPGNGDNSIFNLLRLQPGILAAGEQSNDLIIWGSYEGQSQLLFDGFTLFGMKNFNDNISAVNPYMAKDIQVFKGGFGADYGERVGGLVNITGIDGDKESPHANFNLNNMTLNGMFSLPVQQKASLAVAFRQTYYELYDTGVLTFGRGRNTDANSVVDRYLYPDYNFRDVNVKFSGQTNSGDSYRLSLLGATDRFKYSVSDETAQRIVLNEQNENNYQTGGSFFYGKGWANGSQSHFTVAASGIETQFSRFRQVRRTQGNGKNGNSSTTVRIDEDARNQVGEVAAKLDHQLMVSDQNQLKIGLDYYYDRVQTAEDSFQVNLFDQELADSRLSSFVQDQLSLFPGFQIKGGLRVDYPFSLQKIYFQPRFSASAHLGDYVKLNGAWGIYNQFLVRSSVLDDDGTYRYFWTISDEDQIPVQDSRHVVLGFNFSKNNFTFSVEGYNKHTHGQTRYINNQRAQDVFVGESKSKGLDFFIKQDYKGHSAWVSYSLSQTLEKLSYFPRMEWRRALHDQRHELKVATLLSFKPFFFSMNYVYGSGFPDPLNIESGDELEKPYKRFDAALICQLISKKVLLEAGVSVLNVFNYENVKYDNFVRIPPDQEIGAALLYQAEAVPFTPTMFINFSF